jgi:hypothetical protein
MRRVRTASGNVGAIPTKPRSMSRASPNLSPGSRCWTRVKMSPLRSLSGSHQPRPSWLTIRISASPRRYFRLWRVLCARSSRHGGGSRSSSAAQLTPAFSHSISASCSLIGPCSSRDRPSRGGGGVMSSPFHLLRCAISPTAKPAWGKGVRSTGVQSATHPCGATGASGSAVVWDGGHRTIWVGRSSHAKARGKCSDAQGCAIRREIAAKTPCVNDRHPKGRDPLLQGSGRSLRAWPAPWPGDAPEQPGEPLGEDFKLARTVRMSVRPEPLNSVRFRW